MNLCECGCGAMVKRRFVVGHSKSMNRSVADRFNEKWTPEPNTGCWLWLGSVNHSGYGMMGCGDKNRLVHRLSYEIYNGAIPDGLCVLHKCDTPSCVNPSHLFLGTPADNARDRGNKNRTARGKANGLAKLTDAQVVEIRKMKGVEYLRVTAARFGISVPNVGHIQDRYTWKHVP